MKFTFNPRAKTEITGRGITGGKMSEPKNYRNISEDWGDRCIVTEDDVRAQAEIYGVEDARITVRNDGIYCDGELIAEAIQQEEK